MSIQFIHPAESHGRIYLRLTVTQSDSQGDRLVPGLGKEDFTVFVNGIPCAIDHFSATPSPSSVAIILDMAGSMREIDLSSVLRTLIDISNAQSVPDEALLIAFARQAGMIKDFAWRVRNINFEGIVQLLDQPDRYIDSGLVSAVKLATDKLLREAGNHNQALVLITDAEEDLTRAATQEMRDQFKGMGLRVYGIFFPGRNRLDRGRLHNLATDTGGRYFRILETTPLELLIRWILHELRYQYVIGLSPEHGRAVDRSEISVSLSSLAVIPGASVRFTLVEAVGRTKRE